MRRKERRHVFIGVIDSGLGGLSVWKEIVHLLPGCPTVYFADQAHVPYGDRSLEEGKGFAEKITRFLLDSGGVIVVLASNTVSAAALHHLRRVFPKITFAGMEPAIKPATAASQSGVVGVMATRATFQGKLFADLLERYAGSVRVITQACPGLVEAVEAGALDDPRTEKLVRMYLQPLLEAGADQLVLGCTHYPFLRPLIEKVAEGRLEIIDPAPAVARQVQRLSVGLHSNIRAPDHVFFTTGNLTSFRRMLRRLLPGIPTKDLHVRKAFWNPSGVYWKIDNNS